VEKSLEGSDLAELADAFVRYETTMVGATREQRMQLLHSPLEGLWAEVLGIFAVNGPEARDLLLLIADRFPDDPMLRDSQQMLIEMWLPSPDPSDYQWLVDTAKTNDRLRRATVGVDFEHLGLDPI